MKFVIIYLKDFEESMAHSSLNTAIALHLGLLSVLSSQLRESKSFPVNPQSLSPVTDYPPLCLPMA